jgi:hypothetical protein
MSAWPLELAHELASPATSVTTLNIPAIFISQSPLRALGGGEHNDVQDPLSRRSDLVGLLIASHPKIPPAVIP